MRLRKQYTRVDIDKAYTLGKFDGTVETVRRMMTEDEATPAPKTRRRRRVVKTRKVAKKAAKVATKAKAKAVLPTRARIVKSAGKK